VQGAQEQILSGPKKGPGVLGGITGLAGLKNRCRIDQENPTKGCWEYIGNCDGVYLAHLGRITSLGAALWALTQPEPLLRGQVYVATCGNTQCANPRHRELMKNGQQSKLPHVLQKFGTAQHRIAIARARRANSTWSEADIAVIRADVGTLVQLAAKWGMSISHMSRIRRGQNRCTGTAPANPFVGLFRSST